MQPRPFNQGTNIREPSRAAPRLVYAPDALAGASPQKQKLDRRGSIIGPGNAKLRSQPRYL